jgi:hypothetical protein
VGAIGLRGAWMAAVLGAVCCETLAQGGEGDQPRCVGTPAPAVWSVRPSREPGAWEFTVRCSGFVLECAEGGLVPRIAGQAAPPGRGLPDVPAVAKLLPGQAGRAARVTVEPSAWELIADVTVPPVERVDFESTITGSAQRVVRRVPDATVFGRDEFWPVEPAAVQAAMMGTQAFVRVECRLVQYNPLRKVLRYCTEMRGRVDFGNDHSESEAPPAHGGPAP